MTSLTHISKHGKTVLITMHTKEINSKNFAQLTDQIKQLIQPQTPNLIIDLADVEFIASVGLGLLLASVKYTKQHQGTVKLVGVNPKVMEIIGLVNLTAFLPHFENVEDALKASD